MNTFHLIISSPDGSKFDGDAVMLSLRGTEGDLAVMAGHIPFVTAVKKGRCDITLEDETVIHATLDGGLLNVAKDCVTLLSSSFVQENENKKGS